MTETDPRPKKPPNTPEVIDGGFENFDEIEVIGSGGNADVTKVGYHGEGPETVALKQPRIQGTMDVDSMDRFLEEAETWDKIDDHDHIVGVLDWDSEPVPWIALEYMDGGSLQDRLGELDAAEALWVGVCLCRAVRHAHRRGIAHLDLKPENVLFRETDGDTWDYPKVADWGLAKMLLEHSKSIEGMSPKYAAPEQFDEETYGKPDDFTDIYAVGAVVYAALTGEPPFEGTAASVMQSVLNDEPVPPSERVDGLLEGTDEVVLKALEKRKDDRYESILDLRRELEELVNQDLTNNKNNETSEGGNTPFNKSTTSRINKAVSGTTASEDISNESIAGQDTPNQSQKATSAPSSQRPSKKSKGAASTSKRLEKKIHIPFRKTKFRVFSIASGFFGLMIILTGVYAVSEINNGVIGLAMGTIGTAPILLGILPFKKPMTPFYMNLIKYGLIAYFTVVLFGGLSFIQGVRQLAEISIFFVIVPSVALLSATVALFAGFLAIRQE